MARSPVHGGIAIRRSEHQSVRAPFGFTGIALHLIVKGLGPTAGVLSGWDLLLAYTLTGMSTLCGFAIFAQLLLGHLGIHSPILPLFALGTILAWYVAFETSSSLRK